MFPDLLSNLLKEKKTEEEENQYETPFSRHCNHMHFPHLLFTRAVVLWLASRLQQSIQGVIETSKKADFCI